MGRACLVFLPGSGESGFDLLFVLGYCDMELDNAICEFPTCVPCFG